MNKTIRHGYYTVDEVAEYIGCSSHHAYKIIRVLNEELKARGFITIAGKVSKAYFDEKYYRH